MSDIDFDALSASARPWDEEAVRAKAIERQPFGPDKFKEVKEQLDLRSVDDLKVMAGNDPFSCGTKGDWIAGEWFAEIFERGGYSLARQAHIRRVHYYHFSVEGMRPPTDQRHAKRLSREKRTDWHYRNDDDDWSYLTAASRTARVLDLVNPRAIVDHRNEDIRSYVPQRIHRIESPSVEIDWDDQPWQLPFLSTHLQLPTELDFEIPGLSVGGYDYEYADRAVIPVVTFEKSTVDDIVDPICRELHMNYLSGTGYQSHTNVVNLLLKMREYGKDAVVLYGSDFDGAGAAMPVAFARAAEFYRHKFGITQELFIQPITLTREQVEEYGLPQSPSKKGDKLVTELDALEALHPGKLARIVREAAAPYVSDDLENELAEAHQEAITITDAAWEGATEEHQGELEEIVGEALEIYESYRERLEEVASELNEEIKPLQEKLNDLRERVSGQPETLDLELPERPEPDEPDIPDLMYDSRRHWFDQLNKFKQWQARHWEEVK